MISQHNCTGQYRPNYGIPITKQSIVFSGHSMQCILNVDVDISSNYKSSMNVTVHITNIYLCQ